MASVHVLIVEDDGDIRETLGEFLTDEGFRVSLAENGRDALTQLQGSLAPDVILLDLSMPIMDGFQFRAEQQKDPLLAPIPVIVVTAGRQLRDVPPELKIITKPPDLAKLLAAIREAVTARERGEV